MTRILVVSDSHGGQYHLEKLPEFVDAVLYMKGIDIRGVASFCGNAGKDARWLEKRLDIPVSFVAGNCDWSAHCDRELRLNVEGKRLLLTHGDRFGVKYGCDRLSYYAEESMMDAALFGHTHRPFAGYVGRALLINPGALKNGSLCVLDISPRDIVPRILDIDQWTPPKTGADEEGDTLL